MDVSSSPFKSYNVNLDFIYFKKDRLLGACLF